MEKLIHYFKSTSTKNKIFTLSELEFFRKIIHALIFFIPFLASASMQFTILILCYGILFYILFEGFRIKGKSIAFFSKLTLLVTRPNEDKTFIKAPLFLLSSSLFVLLLFPLKYASIGILALAFGDTAASLFGRLIGGPKLFFSKTKTISGSLACFLIISTATFRISSNLLLSIIIGFTTSLIEAISPKDFDNLLIPLFAASLASFIVI